jgi:tRNA dimethylallyltransferase
MQVYRHLDIGTAKPGPSERAALPHHLIDIKDPGEQYHAGEFVASAQKLVPEITARGRLPIVAGGTGFYVRNFVFGLPRTPEGTPQSRARARARLEAEGAAALYAELARLDPATAGRISENDTYRILRALEVYEISGRPLSSFDLPQRPREDFQVMLVGLWRDRAELTARIEERVGAMMASGLPAEVEAVCRMGYGPTSPGLRGIGYREFFSAAGDAACDFTFLGEDRLAAVTEEIIRGTRRYAKRQMTFFRRLPGVEWIHADDEEALNACVDAARV